MSDLDKQYKDSGLAQIAFNSNGQDFYPETIRELLEWKAQAEKEARIDEVVRYNNHCAKEMALLQGDYDKNSTVAAAKAKGYGSPFARNRLAQLKGGA